MSLTPNQATEAKKKVKEQRAKAKGKGKRRRKGKGKGKGKGSREEAAEASREGHSDDEGDSQKLRRLKSEMLFPPPAAETVSTSATPEHDHLNGEDLFNVVMANPGHGSNSSSSRAASMVADNDKGAQQETAADDGGPVDGDSAAKVGSETADNNGAEFSAMDPMEETADIETDGQQHETTDNSGVPVAVEGAPEAPSLQPVVPDDGGSERPTGPSAAKGPLGPRGPNLHSSPATLGDLAPPGCTISLNSSLIYVIIS